MKPRLVLVVVKDATNRKSFHKSVSGQLRALSCSFLAISYYDIRAIYWTVFSNLTFYQEQAIWNVFMLIMVPSLDIWVDRC